MVTIILDLEAWIIFTNDVSFSERHKSFNRDNKGVGWMGFWSLLI